MRNTCSFKQELNIIMPSNVEIKASVQNLVALAEKASALADSHTRLLHEDTYFKIQEGRLKLRQMKIPSLNQSSAELIFYDRPNMEGPKLSNYKKQTFGSENEAEGLKDVLRMSLGIRGIVKKIRDLYMVGQTRVHVDQVDTLGNFMELEVQLRPEQSVSDGEAIAEDLMQKLAVNKEDLLTGSYIDLIGC